ncbi:MAG: hypothetical protein AAB614_01815, partial [Patescibacteria group bacterium]
MEKFSEEDTDDLINNINVSLRNDGVLRERKDVNPKFYKHVLDESYRLIGEVNKFSSLAAESGISEDAREEYIKQEEFYREELKKVQETLTKMEYESVSDESVVLKADEDGSSTEADRVAQKGIIKLSKEAEELLALVDSDPQALSTISIDKIRQILRQNDIIINGSGTKTYLLEKLREVKRKIEKMRKDEEEIDKLSQDIIELSKERYSKKGKKLKKETVVHEEGLKRIIPELKELIKKINPTEEDKLRIKELRGHLEEERGRLARYDVVSRDTKKAIPPKPETEGVKGNIISENGETPVSSKPETEVVIGVAGKGLPDEEIQVFMDPEKAVQEKKLEPNQELKKIDEFYKEIIELSKQVY